MRPVSVADRQKKNNEREREREGEGEQALLDTENLT